MPKFYAVGIGAGSGGYITLGALRVLEKADVIASPVTKAGEKSTALEILKSELNTDKKEILYLEFSMRRDKEKNKQYRSTAAEKIIRELEQGKTVAMITLGDASVYSTCSYVTDYVRGAGFETETIPAVPSFIAAADALGISLCQDGETFAVIPSAQKDKIEKYLEAFDTLVIMKAGKNISALYELLQKRGLENNAFVCANIGMETELTEKIRKSGEYGYFTTVIIKKKL